jgi:hypothetical protein
MLLREWRTGSDYHLRNKTVSAQEIRQRRCRNKPQVVGRKKENGRGLTYQWLGHTLPPLARDPTWEASFLLQRSAVNRLKLLPPIPPKRHSSALEGRRRSRSSASLRENKNGVAPPLCISVSIGFPGPNPNPNSLNVRLCKIRVSNLPYVPRLAISNNQSFFWGKLLPKLTHWSKTGRVNKTNLFFG